MSGSGVRRWYPRTTLLWSSGFSLLLLAMCVWGWFGLERSIRMQFTAFQIATLIFFVLVMIGIMMGVGTCTVIADEQGLRVRNALWTKRLAWSQIAAIRYRQGDPWAFAVHADDPDDPSRTMLLGIQATDGERAHRAVAELRELLAEHSGGGGHTRG